MSKAGMWRCGYWATERTTNQGIDWCASIGKGWSRKFKRRRLRKEGYWVGKEVRVQINTRHPHQAIWKVWGRCHSNADLKGQPMQYTVECSGSQENKEIERLQGDDCASKGADIWLPPDKRLGGETAQVRAGAGPTGSSQNGSQNGFSGGYMSLRCQGG